MKKYIETFSNLKEMINQKLKVKSFLRIGYTYAKGKGPSLYHVDGDGRIVKIIHYHTAREMEVAMESYLQAISMV